MESLPAESVHGVEFPEAIELGGQPLVLNGTALRTVFLVGVYVAGLYVAEPSSDASLFLERDKNPKRLRMVMLREVSEEKFSGAVRENLDQNFSDAEKEQFRPELEQFFECFHQGIRKLEKGSEVTVDFIPGRGTVLGLDGKELATIPGEAFYHAILRLWIGDPLQASIREGLLGDHRPGESEPAPSTP